mgnify:CR=1 FL=1
MLDALEYFAGSLHGKSVMRIAESAACWLVTCDRAMAVCLSPTSRVTVEEPAEAVDEDVIGTYSPELGRIELYRRIRDDLRCEIVDRQDNPESGQKTPPVRALEKAA